MALLKETKKGAGLVNRHSHTHENSGTKQKESAAGLKKTIRDHTLEISRARRRLTRLSSTLIRKMENERRYIARELHDEIGQALSLIKVNLQSMQRMPGAVSFALALEEVIGIIDNSISQVRTLSYNLRPSILDDHGIEAALKWLIERKISKSGLEIKLISGLRHTRYPVDIETACFRVAQEALTNIIKHAKAQRVLIKVSEGKGLSLSVSDDGAGFDVKKALGHCMRGDSFGLLGMQERAALAGGGLRISSRPEKGAKVTATFPLKRSPGR